MVTYPENVQRNRWLGILDLFLRTGNGALEGPSGPPVVGGGCDSIQNGGQIRINPPPTTGGPGGPSTLLIWITIGSGNGSLLDGTKPLPEPMLTYHQ